MSESRVRKLAILFTTTFAISMTANSGYAILSVMKNTFVQKYRWFTEEEMNDYIAMAPSIPGPIAISASMITGYQAAGLAGALAAVSGCALPPLLVMMIVTFFYNSLIANPHVALFLKGMQYGVAAMLLDVLLGLVSNALKKERIYPVILIVLSFLYIRFLRWSVFFLAGSCIVLGVLRALFSQRKEEK